MTLISLPHCIIIIIIIIIITIIIITIIIIIIIKRGKIFTAMGRNMYMFHINFR